MGISFRQYFDMGCAGGPYVVHCSEDPITLDIYIHGDCGSPYSSYKSYSTDRDLYIFNHDGEHVFDCSVEQTDHSVEQRLSLAYRGDLS
jgi:hypothetical protein